MHLAKMICRPVSEDLPWRSVATIITHREMNVTFAHYLCGLLRILAFGHLVGCLKIS
jgi:hypothetical protein